MFKIGNEVFSINDHDLAVLKHELNSPEDKLKIINGLENEKKQWLISALQCPFGHHQ